MTSECSPYAQFLAALREEKPSCMSLKVSVFALSSNFPLTHYLLEPLDDSMDPACKFSNRVCSRTMKRPISEGPASRKQLKLESDVGEADEFEAVFH